MKLVRRTMMAAAALAGLAAAFSAGAADARPASRSESGVAPYCVMISGARGMTLPQICRFFRYRHCLQAAADLRGNCVQNIDYRGPPPDTEGANWARGGR